MKKNNELLEIKAYLSTLVGEEKQYYDDDDGDVLINEITYFEKDGWCVLDIHHTTHSIFINSMLKTEYLEEYIIGAVIEFFNIENYSIQWREW